MSSSSLLPLFAFKANKGMRTDISIGIFDLIIFLGVFQGLFLSLMFLKKSNKQNKANLFQGLVLGFLSLTIFEELLNNTGYIVKLLPISNYSEPLNFTFAPLVFLYVSSALNPEKSRRSWVHMIPAVFWLLYMFFAFVQPDEVKYNSYVMTKHPDWEYLDVVMKINDDPLGVRAYINQLTISHFFIYLGASAVVLMKKLKSLGQSFIRTDHAMIRILRNSILHYLAIVLIYLGTKLYFGMDSDIGGYLIASYISLMIFVTSYQVMIRSDYFNYPHSFLAFPVIKYQKSPLTHENKNRIWAKVMEQMEEHKFFADNLASLANLTKAINEPRHHVSQVINEQFGKSFFELIAYYRVEEAKKILQEDTNKKITIEDLADEVGYNSKSSFNAAFKKHTGQTPSEFRNLSN